MRVLICIDDTDNLDSKGTGELAEEIAQTIEKKRWGTARGVTRHQLLVHSDIPYTSHNSAMCFESNLDDSKYLNSLIEYASDFLKRESAEGSDPGLCVAVPEQIENQDSLIAFGQRAKQAVLTKGEAYELADRLGVHLSEHGGTGQGVIGALAGTGLRLSGNDGRFKGKLKIPAEGGVITVGDILNHPGVDVVKSLDGQVLKDNDTIKLGEKVKTVLLEGLSVLLVYKDNDAADGIWHTCTKQQLRKY